MLDALILVLRLALEALLIGLGLSSVASILTTKEVKLTYRNLFTFNGLFFKLPIGVFLEEVIRGVCLLILSAILFFTLHIPFWSVSLIILILSGIIDAFLHLSNIEESSFFGTISYFVVHFFIGILFAYYFLTYGFLMMFAIHYLYDLIAISLGFILMKLSGQKTSVYEE